MEFLFVGQCIFLIIVLTIALLILYSKYSKLLKDFNKLKSLIKYSSELDKSINNNKNSLSNINSNINDNVNSNLSNKVITVSERNTNDNIVLTQMVNSSKNTKAKNPTRIKREKLEKKNITILITGALCIILAAIVFLTSTWATIPSILKTSIIALLTFVFLGASKIAKEKFKLPKASKAFFYIAMAYIPLSLLSISLFGLLGDYLSIFGEGRYIYLSLTSIFIAVLYLLIYKKEKNLFILYGSILSQFISIILVNLIFNSNIIIIAISLLLYNIAVINLTPNKKIYRNIYPIIPILCSVLCLTELFKCSYSLCILFLLLSANYLMLFLKQNNKIFATLFNSNNILAGITLFITLFNGHLECILISSLAFVLLNNALTHIFTKKNTDLLGSLNIINIIALIILHVVSFDITSNFNILIQALYSIAICCLFIGNYMNPKYKKYSLVNSIFITIYYFMTFLILLSKTQNVNIWLILIGTSTIIVSSLFKKNSSYLKNSLLIGSNFINAFNFLNLLILGASNYLSLILNFLVLIGFIYSYINTKTLTYKYLAYLSIISLVMLMANIAFDTYPARLIGFELSVLLIMGLELIFKSEKDSFSDKFVLFMQAFCFFLLSVFKYDIDSNVNILQLSSILFAILILIYNKYVNNNSKLNCIPLIGLLFTLYLPNITMLEDISSSSIVHFTALNILNIILEVVFTLFITYLSFNCNEKREFNMFKVFSFIFTLFCVYLVPNIYIQSLILIAWAIVIKYFSKDKNIVNILLGLQYIMFFRIFDNLLIDFKLDDILLLYNVAYLVLAILFLKTILNKYIKGNDIDALEYITFGIIYFMMMEDIPNVQNAILISSLLALVLILAYYLKYGTLFITTAISLIFAIFLLTREFWAAVPWWVYLLVVGFVLISFAVKNEAANNKTKNKNPIKFIKKVKDLIEK